MSDVLWGAEQKALKAAAYEELTELEGRMLAVTAERDHWKAAAEQLWAGEKAQDEEDRGLDYLERTGQISAEPEHGGF